MLSREFLGGSLASLLVAGAMLLAPASANAMSPAPIGAYAASDVQNVGCLLGAHIGPLGACVGGYGYGYRHHCWINRWGNRVCN
jgi:hypothetical protein